MKIGKSSRSKTFIVLLLALVLLFVMLGINLLVNLVVNRLVQDTLVKSVNNANNSLNFNLNVRAFPYPKISISHLRYQHEGKPAVFIRDAYLNIALSDLFKKQLHIYTIDVDGASINLTNFPKLEIKKVNNEYQEKKSLSQTVAEGSVLDVEAINLKDITIIYSTSPQDLPLHIKTIQIKQISSINNGPPLNVDVTLSNNLPNPLAAEKPPSNCPLSRFITDIIKGINLKLTIKTEQQENTSANKLVVYINTSGLTFGEGSVSTNWQEILNLCFNY